MLQRRSFTFPIAVAMILVARPLLAESPRPVDFGRDVLPILSDKCFLCHGPDAKARKARLRLDVHDGALRTKDPVIVAGRPDESELIARISSDDPDERMPPPDSGRTLSPAQVATLTRWVKEGAPWSGHWAFQPPHKPAPPGIQNAAWPRNPIDRFVLARLEAEGLVPAPEASKTTLIRRVSLDLTGLPPTPREVDAFLSDSAPDAYERMVDRLLASSRYGEQMATDWLDAARYADTNGYQNDFARTMWPWRDWVIDAFNRNLPFDRFVIEQLAGDLLPHSTRAQRVATGFNRNNRTVTEAGSIDEEWRIENAVDRVETTTMAFLGLTMGCARCHDHKFDPVSQDEFYSFLAFFNNVNEKGVYTETRGNVPPLLKIPRRRDLARLEQLDVDIAAAVQLAAERKGALPDPSVDDALARLRKARVDAEAAIPSVMVMEDRPAPRDTFVLKRGRYDMPDTTRKVAPGVPACLGSSPSLSPLKTRLDLARWLVAPGQPLTARVAVNRAWQHHFGTGLVKTAENFGLQGEPPSHPALLDWLAVAFVEGGWDVKALHRLIVTSAAYRQASTLAPSLLARDPENRLIARGPRLRLPAEAVRDNALAIAGLLVAEVGGPSVKPYQPEGLWAELAGGAGEGPYVQSKGAELYRRSLYIYRKRTVPHPAMATFDAPSREICQVKRARTNTPLQALELLNDVTYVEAARSLAQRMLHEGGRTLDERLTFAVRRAVARPPTSAELRVLRMGLERALSSFAADRDAAAQFVRQGASPLPPGLNTVELAAYTAAAGVILNLDETVTRE